MPRSLRLACLAAAALALCLPAAARACLPPPPPPPPPQAAGESDADFDERRRKWYAAIAERVRQEALPGRIAHEDRLWATAERVVLARAVRIGSIWLRGSEGQRFESPLVTLRPIVWLKGKNKARRLQVHELSDDSCDFGGAGDATEGEVGDVFLLFYRRGPPEPGNIIDTLDSHRAVTARSLEAFAAAAPEE